MATVRALPDPALVEDSGLLVAAGREPLVDDLFLWSRLLDRGGTFNEGRALLDAVGTRRFVRIVSEADLERLDEAPAYERQRWAGSLVRQVLDRYRLERHEGALCLYVPRRHRDRLESFMDPLQIGQLVIAIAVATSILLQARGTGLSSTFGGESTAYRSRRGLERTLFRLTIVLITVFVVISLVGARNASTG